MPAIRLSKSTLSNDNLICHQLFEEESKVYRELKRHSKKNDLLSGASCISTFQLIGGEVEGSVTFSFSSITWGTSGVADLALSCPSPEGGLDSSDVDNSKFLRLVGVKKLEICKNQRVGISRVVYQTTSHVNTSHLLGILSYKFQLEQLHWSGNCSQT